VWLLDLAIATYIVALRDLDFVGFWYS